MQTRALLVASLFLVFAAPNAASQLSAEAAWDTDLVRIESEGYELEVNYIVECRWMLQNTAANGMNGLITVEPSLPPFLLLKGPTTQVISGAPCLTGAMTTSTIMSWALVATKDAPGLRTFSIALNATLSNGLNGTGGGTSPKVNSAIPVTVEAKINSTLEAPRKIALVKSDSGKLVLTVHNQGNVRTLYDVKATATNGAKLRLPDAMILGSAIANGGKDEGILTIGIIEPKGRWKAVVIEVTIEQKSADQPSLVGEPMTATLLFSNTNAWEKNVPGPPLILILFALGLAAAGRRRH